jgi:DNA-binding response OmpR family regulator
MDGEFVVLLVEDDPALAESTAENLTLLGHRVTWVPTAAKALAVLSATHAFEVILLDLRLGDDSGDSIFDQLRLLKITYPPVIVLSAEPAEVMRLAAQRIDTNHMLAKPASIWEIDQALKRAVAA